jgi:hypothetical protein
MNIKGFKIIKNNLIEFSTSKGIGIGTWNNNEVAGGREYSVEFDINQKLEIGKNAKVISDKIYSIRHHDGVNEIQGMVDRVDEDGLIYFRLRLDCLIMIETEKKEFKEGDWLSLTIGLEDLIVTPFGW